jgi:5-methylcytosine-specific restriction endonuclease McrA
MCSSGRQRIVAAYRPAVAVRDRVRPVRTVAKTASPVRRQDAASLFAEVDVRSSDNGSTGCQASFDSGSSDCRDTGRIPSRVSHSRRREWNSREVRGDGNGVAPPAAAASTGTATEPHFKVQFAAGPEFVRKLEEARAILSSGSPRGVSLEQVLETALDAFLDRKSPFRRKARRDRSVARRKVAPTAAPRSIRRTIGGTVAGEIDRSGEADRSRHIPAAVRDAVFARDGGLCTFVGEHGVPCESRHNLHVDHIEPFARGGPPTAGDLRLLCVAHNQLEAERVYGSEWMRRFRR